MEICKPSGRGRHVVLLSRPTDRGQRRLLTGWQCDGVRLVTHAHRVCGGVGLIHIAPYSHLQTFVLNEAEGQVRQPGNAITGTESLDTHKAGRCVYK